MFDTKQEDDQNHKAMFEEGQYVSPDSSNGEHKKVIDYENPEEAWIIDEWVSVEHEIFKITLEEQDARIAFGKDFI